MGPALFRETMEIIILFDPLDRLDDGIQDEGVG